VHLADELLGDGGAAGEGADGMSGVAEVSVGAGLVSCLAVGGVIEDAFEIDGVPLIGGAWRAGAWALVSAVTTAARSVVAARVAAGTAVVALTLSVTGTATWAVPLSLAGSAGLALTVALTGPAGGPAALALSAVLPMLA
jgi:hypothetical protein